MIELSQLILLIMIEMLIGLAILSAVLGYFTLARKGRIRKAANNLAERVQSDKPARTERLKTLLNEVYGLTGNDLEQTLHNITQMELRLFQNLINGYIKDDQVNLQQVDVDEENLVLAYQGLKPVQSGNAPAAATDEEDIKAEMERLRDENQRLADELRMTMDTMGRMLNEYSSMFDGGPESPLTQTAATPPEETSGESAEPAPTEQAAEQESVDGEIPEAHAQDAMAESAAVNPDELLDNATEATSSLDEEVSEIIDEVMEIADEMTQGEEEKAEPPPAKAGESLLDDLQEVDIELPEAKLPQESQESEAGAEAQSEAGSLEEEWAKLLEEDAASKQESGQE
ncbi:MAG: hypothetical protein PVI92_02900 [Chromatiales bacterium]|jgi:hypothetical protein